MNVKRVTLWMGQHALDWRKGTSGVNYPVQPGLLQPGRRPGLTGVIISAMAQNSFCPLMENIMNTLCPSRSFQTAVIRSLHDGRLVTAPLARQYFMSIALSTFMQMMRDWKKVSHSQEVAN